MADIVQDTAGIGRPIRTMSALRECGSNRGWSIQEPVQTMVPGCWFWKPVVENLMPALGSQNREAKDQKLTRLVIRGNGKSSSGIVATGQG